jgi:hypothetical protein
MHDCYSFVFLSDLSVGLANYIDLSLVGEVLCSGFNLAVSLPSDRRGLGTYCLVATKDKMMGFIHND